MKTPYVQARNPLTKQWIKIDTRTCTIINHRDFPYLYTPFALPEYADLVRKVHRGRKEFAKDLEYALWFGERK